MTNLKMFCLTMLPEHGELINKLNYHPVGLGDKKFTNYFLTDKDGQNISHKNSHYGEYTFHYWIWKNNYSFPPNTWIGFCQYRKFWTLKKTKFFSDKFQDFKKILITNIPKDFEPYESILGEPMFINDFKISKLVKKNFFSIFKKPSLIFDKRKRNIKFHFDTMHGSGNLAKAIKLLPKQDRDDFENFVTTEVSFNPHNMFICNSQEILFEYYNAVFPWLTKCENEFGFNLEGYGLKRLYGFLAERYMSFWFKKYTKFTTLPIVFKDISQFIL